MTGDLSDIAALSTDQLVKRFGANARREIIEIDNPLLFHLDRAGFRKPPPCRRLSRRLPQPPTADFWPPVTLFPSPRKNTPLQPSVPRIQLYLIRSSCKHLRS